MKQLIEYIEGLTVTQGDLVGEGVTVFPWERKFLKGAFAPGVSTSALIRRERERQDQPHCGYRCRRA